MEFAGRRSGFGTCSLWNGTPVAGTSNGEIRELLTDVDNLVRKVAHVKDVEIAKVRDKVANATRATRESMLRSARQVQSSGRSAARSTDTYVHDHPWTALGLAAALGVVVGLMSSRR